MKTIQSYWYWFVIAIGLAFGYLGQEPNGTAAKNPKADAWISEHPTAEAVATDIYSEKSASAYIYSGININVYNNDAILSHIIDDDELDITSPFYSKTDYTIYGSKELTIETLLSNYWNKVIAINSDSTINKWNKFDMTYDETDSSHTITYDYNVNSIVGDSGDYSYNLKDSVAIEINDDFTIEDTDTYNTSYSNTSLLDDNMTINFVMLNEANLIE